MSTVAALDPQLQERFKSLGRLIGNTPLLAVDVRLRGILRTVYCKSEQLNMTGSIKDRMALHILECAYREGRIRPGDTIVEATSGNTGISFAALGRALGHPVVIYMPDWMSRERVDLIRSYGAHVVPVTREQGGFVGSIRMAEDLASSDDHVFLPRQFSNEANVQAHELTTGPEIWWQLQFHGLAPDAFVAGIGTGGTVMGVGRCLRALRPGIRVHPLEPMESPTLRTGHKCGQHRIQGISDEFIPDIVDLAGLDSVVDVSDGDAIRMSQALASRLGLAVGISSGANFLGALKVQEELGAGAVVATVFPDDNKKYLSTALLGEEPVKSGHLAPEVELTGLRVFKRVCHTCCEAEGCPQRDFPQGSNEGGRP
ncbi:MAG: cysteine synthase family protein [Candidatus Eisenbacteria bacterium]|nr:cysteine synthase family protein [Candidatus Eisenbacteria bacterium]